MYVNIIGGWSSSKCVVIMKGRLTAQLRER